MRICDIINIVPERIRQRIPQQMREMFSYKVNMLDEKINYCNIGFANKREKMARIKLESAIDEQYEQYKKLEGVNVLEKPNLGIDMLVIPRMVISVTNRCTLKCEACNNLMPYMTTKKDMSSKEILDDVETLFKFIDCCISVEIIGGEPFLYRDIKEVLEQLINIQKIYMIEITTNATIIPNEDIVSVLKNEKVHIFISKYAAVNSKNREQFIDMLQNNNIKYEIFPMEAWIDSGDTSRRNRSEHELWWDYHNCQAGIYCKALWEGKLFACGRAPGLYEICNKEDTSSYLDVRMLSLTDKQESRKKIKDFYLSTYAGCCDFCDYSHKPIQEIVPGIQRK